MMTADKTVRFLKSEGQEMNKDKSSCRDSDDFC